MNDIIDILNLTGICPILAFAEPDQAVPAAKALVNGGLPLLEVLMKNETSVKIIDIIAREVPQIYVGAGTVLTVDQAKHVIDLGAKFVVMPGFCHKIVEYCLKQGVMVIPGCITPTEIMMALDYGISNVKFFPVFEMGGIKTMSQLNSGPFPNVRFVVTGALDSNNFLPLVEYKNTLAAGGDWMFQDFDALNNHDYDQIARNTRDSVMRVQDMRNAKFRN